MKFLCDMGVSMRSVEWLREMGHEAVHLREQGLQRLPNGEILAKARREGRIVITFDLGFGELMAAGGSDCPSVIVLRLANARAENVIDKLRRVIVQSSNELEKGAIVSVGEARYRIRSLPIRRGNSGA